MKASVASFEEGDEGNSQIIDLKQLLKPYGVS